MAFLQLLRKACERNRILAVLHPGSRLVLESGRIVRIRRLNLRRALTALCLVAQVLERIGWEKLGEKPLLQLLMHLATAGGEELVEILSLLTEEDTETLLHELTPADAVRILLTAFEQEFGGRHNPDAERAGEESA